MTTRERERREVYAKSPGACTYCGGSISFDGFHDEHVVARARGGPNHLWNRVPSCLPCNKFKGDADADFVRQRLALDGGQFEILEVRHGDDGRVLWTRMRAKTELVRFHAEDLILAAVQKFRETVKVP